MTGSKRGRGRPAVGARIELRLPDHALEAVDHEAETLGVTRSELLRRIVLERYPQQR